MNTLQLEKFEGVAKFLRVLLKILFILCIAGGAIALIGAVISLLVPSSLINELTGLLNTIDTSFKMGDVYFHRSDFALTVADIRTIAISGFIIVAFAAIVAAYIFFQLRKVLDNVVGKTPFAQEAIIAIKKLSIAIIVYSLFTSIGGFITSSMLSNYLSTATSSLVERIDFNFDFAFILVGFLVYLLAKIFEYGSSLQHEVDEML